MDVVKSKSSHSGRRYKGIALVLVTFIIAILTISGSSLLFMSYHAKLSAIQLGEETACRALTDAGLRMGIGTLNAQHRGGTINDFNLPISVGETVQGMKGTFSYQVIKDVNDDVYVVTSVGTSGDLRRIEVAKLQLQAESYFDHAILTKDKAANLGAGVSAYNPDDPNAAPGTYPVTLGSLCTEDPSVTLGGTVYGDVFTAVGSDPNSLIVGLDNITGSAYALADEPNIVTPVMPDDLFTYGTDLSVTSETVTLTPEDSGIYNRLALLNHGGPATVYIDGGTVTLGLNVDLNMGRDCEIIVNEGSTLILYVGTGVACSSGASMTYNSANPDPSHIQIYGTGPAGGKDVYTLKSKDVFQGVIYAPNVEVAISSATEIVGAVVANQFTSGAGISYLYDTSLATATNIALGESHYEVNRWSESVASEIPEWAQ